MSEMVERVARAMHIGFDTYGPVARELALIDARKAIEAMRMPTGAMIDRAAGFDEKTPWAILESVWEAMIDEALK